MKAGETPCSENSSNPIQFAPLYSITAHSHYFKMNYVWRATSLQLQNNDILKLCSHLQDSTSYRHYENNVNSV
jgi:hypothetical protein